MEGRPVRRERRRAWRRVGGSLLVAALILGGAPDAQSRKELIQQASRLSAEVKVVDADARRAAVATLQELVDTMDRLVAEGGDPRAYNLPRYYAFRGLAVGDQERTEDERLDWIDRSIEYGATLGDEAAANVRYVKAELLLGFGRVRDAHAVLTDTLEAAPGAARTLPTVLYALAETELRMALYSDALARCDAAEALLVGELENSALRPRISGTRGQVYLQMGLPDVAAEHIGREVDAIAQWRAAGFGTAKDYLAADVHRANLLLAGGDHVGAAAFLGELLSDADRFPDGSGARGAVLAMCGEAVSLAFRGSADEERRAESLLRQALASDLAEPIRLGAEDRLAGLLMRRGEQEEPRALLASARARLAAWEEVEGALGEHPEEVNLRATEARLALSAGAPPEELASLRDAYGAALRARIALWRTIPPRAGGLGFLHHAGRRAWIAGLARLELALGGDDAAERALEWVLLAQAQGTLLRRMEGAEVSVADVRAELGAPRRAHLVFLPAPEGSLLFVLDETTTRAFTLRPEAELDRLRVDLITASATDVDEARARLGAALVPVAVRADGESWVELSVVGLDLFGRLPIESLTVEGVVLGERWAVNRLPSLPLGVALARRPGAEARALDVVFIAAPEDNELARERWPELDTLPWSGEEAAILAPFEPQATRAFTGARATVSAGLDPELLRTARVLHVLAHSALDTEAERPPTLVLTAGDGDGLVASDELERLPVPPLAIFTACRGGVGPARRGDEATSHLGGAALLAGARAVVLTHEAVALDDAVDFSRIFHAALAKGASPARAAAEARRAAPFFVLGLGHEPVFPERVPETPVATTSAPPPAAETNEATDADRPWLLIGAGALGALAVGLFVLSRRSA